MNVLHSAYLYIGNQEQLTNIILTFIKAIICSNKGCNICINCAKIDKKQHHLLCWLEPENQYSVNQLDIIFETIIYALKENEHFFFVINRADLLNINSANRLLKSLEEPPIGYHFILTAISQDNVLPTISSRCLIQHFGNFNNQNNLLFQYFTTELKNTKISEFISLLENQKFLERDIPELLDVIYNFWLDVYKKAIQENNVNLLDKSESILDIIDKSREHMPMPGSAKMFLKNLFLQFILLNNL